MLRRSMPIAFNNASIEMEIAEVEGKAKQKKVDKLNKIEMTIENSRRLSHLLMHSAIYLITSRTAHSKQPSGFPINATN